MHGGGFDVTAFAHQQGGSIDMHMNDDCALALQRSQTQAVTYPINMQVAIKNGTKSPNGLGIGNDGDPSPTLGANDRHAVGTNSAVRRLTPRECERLQGFPDDFTRIPWRKKPAEECPDGPRYKALGNSMAVPVMHWIGERIQMVNELSV